MTFTVAPAVSEKGFAVLQAGEVVRYFTFKDWTKARAEVMAKGFARQCEKWLADDLAAELGMAK
jgi:hypothetical protein